MLDTYLESLAQEDNEAKKSGLFCVDLRADGSFTVPHDIDRPLLRFQIWQAADMIKWFLGEDHLRASVTGKRISPTEGVEALLGAVLARRRSALAHYRPRRPAAPIDSIVRSDPTTMYR